MAQATFVETSKGRRSIVHEGYIYQKIRENGERSWWRCKDRTCKGKLRLENGQVTATTGEHFHPPSQAQTSANIVISSMKRRAREESVPLPQIYRQEMTKLYGGPGCDETAVNVPSFQNLKSSIAAGFRGFQHCLKHEKRLTSVESGLEQPVRRTSY